MSAASGTARPISGAWELIPEFDKTRNEWLEDENGEYYRAVPPVDDGFGEWFIEETDSHQTRWHRFRLVYTP